MVITSRLRDLTVPDQDMWTFILGTPKPFPDSHRIFIDADTRREQTFGDVKNGSIEFGKGLKHMLKWNKGDVLTVISPNSIDIPVVNFGCLWAGGVVNTANPAYTVDEITHQLKDARTKAIVTQKAFLPAVCAAAAKVGIPKENILLLGDERDETGMHRHFTEINAADAWIQPRKTPIDPKKDLAFIVYSSGTTGLPKGVPLSHYNLVINTLQLHRYELRTLDWELDGQLGVLPFFHIYGIAVIVMCSLLMGIKCVVMSRFNLQQACKVIQDDRLTVLYVPPPIVLALGKDPSVSNYDLSSLRFINSAAAPVSNELVMTVWDRLHIGVKQGWGLSEASPTVTVQSSDEWYRFSGSVGKLVPNMTAKIVDPDGKEVATGEAGEILLRGPNIFSGYWNRPDLEKETFTDDGWYRTGDVGYVSEAGNFYLTDRIKELIKYKGFQVAPADLEAMLVGREDVADVCVVGVYDDSMATELPRAYVVLTKGTAETPEKAKEIADWMAGRVANHKKLRGGVRFVGEIPKSPAGKILRRILKAQAKKESEPKAKL